MIYQKSQCRQCSRLEIYLFHSKLLYLCAYFWASIAIQVSNMYCMSIQKCLQAKFILQSIKITNNIRIFFFSIFFSFHSYDRSVEFFDFYFFFYSHFNLLTKNSHFGFSFRWNRLKRPSNYYLLRKPLQIDCLASAHDQTTSHDTLN